MTREEKVFNHESYGIVGFHRQTGGKQRLFGSALASHTSQICLRVFHAERVHKVGTGYDRIRAEAGHRPIIELVLSPAQFAELLTTMNVGDGVPCTLERIDGRPLSDPPAEETTGVEESRANFQIAMRQKLAEVREQREQLSAILEKKTLSADDKKKIAWILDRTVMEFEQNVPYAVDMFEKAAGRVVTAAKAEVDAFATHAIIDRGLRGLAEDCQVALLTGKSE